MKKKLLFTSAGDISTFYNYWVDNSLMEYDIFVCFYGKNKKNELKNYCKYYYERKGSKLQNFNYIYQNNIFNIKDNYEYFALFDDDVITNVKDINELFNFIEKNNDIYLLQPSFDKETSKISHEITKQYSSENLYRFTNFIEITCFFLNKSILEKCLFIYDDCLVGYGLDYLFIWYLGQNLEDKYVIYDKISVINPKPLKKTTRQIDMLQKETDRIKNWNRIKLKYKINEWKHINFKIIN
jgi:hypothetical protein